MTPLAEVFGKDPDALTLDDRVRIVDYYKSHRHLFATKALKMKSWDVDDIVEEAMKAAPVAKPRKRQRGVPK